jgi:hypothetical protein
MVCSQLLKVTVPNMLLRSVNSRVLYVRTLVCSQLLILTVLDTLFKFVNFHVLCSSTGYPPPFLHLQHILIKMASHARFSFHELLHMI